MTELDFRLFLESFKTEFKEDVSELKETLKSINAKLDLHANRLTSVERDAAFLQGSITDLIVRKDADHLRIWDNFEKCKADGQARLEDKLKNSIKNSNAGAFKWIAGIIIAALLGVVGFMASNFMIPAIVKQERSHR